MSDIALNWIDGEWLTSTSIATSHNPANGEVVGQFADGGEVEAEAAIKAARGALAAGALGVITSVITTRLRLRPKPVLAFASAVAAIAWLSSAFGLTDLRWRESEPTGGRLGKCRCW